MESTDVVGLLRSPVPTPYARNAYLPKMISSLRSIAKGGAVLFGVCSVIRKGRPACLFFPTALMWGVRLINVIILNCHVPALLADRCVPGSEEVEAVCGTRPPA